MKVTTDACLFGAWCAAEIKNIGVKPETGLDIGTGTGLLSLQVVQKNDLVIDAIEVDREAALQAKENMVCSAWKNKIEVINVDAMKFNSPKKYDVIFSNPPFYEFELQSSNAKRNLAHHGHGLKIEDVLSIIKKHLHFSGCFFLLLPYKRFDEINLLFTAKDLHVEKICIVSPAISHLPFRVMIKGNHTRSITTQNNMAIKNEENVYTEDFVALLKDYYLHL